MRSTVLAFATTREPMTARKMVTHSTLHPIRRHPFKLVSGEFITSRDVVDLKTQLGQDYSLGSFDKVSTLVA